MVSSDHDVANVFALVRLGRRRQLKWGPAHEGGYWKWFAWSAVAVGVLALVGLKARGIVVAAVVVQPEVTMEIIKSSFTHKVVLAASVETAWSIFVNLFTGSHPTSADDAMKSMQ